MTRIKPIAVCLRSRSTCFRSFESVYHIQKIIYALSLDMSSLMFYVKGRNLKDWNDSLPLYVIQPTTMVNRKRFIRTFRWRYFRTKEISWRAVSLLDDRSLCDRIFWFTLPIFVRHRLRFSYLFQLLYKYIEISLPHSPFSVLDINSPIDRHALLSRSPADDLCPPEWVSHRSDGDSLLRRHNTKHRKLEFCTTRCYFTSRHHWNSHFIECQ